MNNNKTMCYHTPGILVGVKFGDFAIGGFYISDLTDIPFRMLRIGQILYLFIANCQSFNINFLLIFL